MEEGGGLGGRRRESRDAAALSCLATGSRLTASSLWLSKALPLPNYLLYALQTCV